MESRALRVAGAVWIVGYACKKIIALRSHNKQLAEAQEQYEVVETTAGLVEYSKIGRAPYVLYSHGTPGGYFAPRELYDAAGYGCIMLSRPGYFRTPLNKDKCSNADAADLMAALLDKIGVDKVLVNGFSGGGPAAIHFAAKFPEKTTGLMLDCAVSGLVEDDDDDDDDDDDSFVGMILDLVWPLDVAFWIARRVNGEDLPPLVGDIAPQMFRRYISADVEEWASPRHWKKGVKNDGTQFTTPDFAACPLAKVTKPTMLTHGKEDKFVPFALAEKAAELIPDVETNFSETCEHGPALWICEEGDRLLKNQVAFMKKLVV